MFNVLNDKYALLCICIHLGVKCVVVNDLLPAATEVAKKNVERNGVSSDRLVFVQNNRYLLIFISYLIIEKVKILQHCIYF